MTLYRCCSNSYRLPNIGLPTPACPLLTRSQTPSSLACSLCAVGRCAAAVVLALASIPSDAPQPVLSEVSARSTNKTPRFGKTAYMYLVCVKLPRTLVPLSQRTATSLPPLRTFSRFSWPLSTLAYSINERLTTEARICRATGLTERSFKMQASITDPTISAHPCHRRFLPHHPLPTTPPTTPRPYPQASRSPPATRSSPPPTSRTPHARKPTL